MENPPRSAGGNAAENLTMNGTGASANWSELKSRRRSWRINRPIKPLAELARISVREDERRRVGLQRDPVDQIGGSLYRVRLAGRTRYSYRKLSSARRHHREAGRRIGDDDGSAAVRAHGVRRHRGWHERGGNNLRRAADAPYWRARGRRVIGHNQDGESLRYDITCRRTVIHRHGDGGDADRLGHRLKHQRAGLARAGVNDLRIANQTGVAGDRCDRHPWLFERSSRSDAGQVDFLPARIFADYKIGHGVQGGRMII